MTKTQQFLNDFFLEYENKHLHIKTLAKSQGISFPLTNILINEGRKIYQKSLKKVKL